MKKIIVLFGILLVLLSSCGAKESSATPVNASAQETMIVQTVNAAVNETATANAPTLNPCTNHGWADIETYLKAYETQSSNIVAGTSIKAYIDGLENIKNQINGVSIDACTENARQMIIAGLENRTQSMQIIMMKGDANVAASMMFKGVTMIKDAIKELSGLPSVSIMVKH